MKKKDFDELKAAVRDMVSIINKKKTPEAVGAKVTPVPAGIRAELKMTQQEFAALLGVSVRTVQDWEQGRRVPTGAARAFLTVIDKEPEAVRRALLSTVASRKEPPATHLPL